MQGDGVEEDDAGACRRLLVAARDVGVFTQPQSELQRDVRESDFDVEGVLVPQSVAFEGEPDGVALLAADEGAGGFACEIDHALGAFRGLRPHAQRVVAGSVEGELVGEISDGICLVVQPRECEDVGRALSFVGVVRRIVDAVEECVARAEEVVYLRARDPAAGGLFILYDLDDAAHEILVGGAVLVFGDGLIAQSPVLGHTRDVARLQSAVRVLGGGDGFLEFVIVDVAEGAVAEGAFHRAGGEIRLLDVGACGRAGVVGVGDVQHADVGKPHRAARESGSAPLGAGAERELEPYLLCAFVGTFDVECVFRPFAAVVRLGVEGGEGGERRLFAVIVIAHEVDVCAFARLDVRRLQPHGDGVGAVGAELELAGLDAVGDVLVRGDHHARCRDVVIGETGRGDAERFVEPGGVRFLGERHRARGHHVGGDGGSGARLVLGGLFPAPAVGLAEGACGELVIRAVRLEVAADAAVVVARAVEVAFGGEVGVERGVSVSFAHVHFVACRGALSCGVEGSLVGVLLEGHVVKERPARGEGAGGEISGAGAARGGRGGIVGVIRLGVLLRAARAKPQLHVVGHVLILVAADIESVGRPSGGRGAALRVAEEDGFAVVGVLGDALDDDVLTVAGEDERDARAVDVVGEDVDADRVEPVLLDDDLTGGADALRRHHLLREHIDVVAHARRGVLRDRVGSVGEHGKCGRPGEFVGAEIIGARIGRHVVLKQGEGDDAVEAVGGGGVVARHQRPAGGRGGADGGGTEVEPAVGGAQGHRARGHLRIARGKGLPDRILVVGGRLIVLVFLIDVGIIGLFRRDAFFVLRLRGLIVGVGKFLQHDVVKEGVARGQTVAVVGAVFAQPQVEGERGGGSRRALDVDGVGLPLAFGVDAGDLGIARGGEIDPRARDVVLVVRARDVVGEHVHAQLIVRAGVEREGLGRVAVGGGTVVVIVVLRHVLGRHVDHEDVVDRVLRVGEVSARDETLIQGLAALVLAAVIVPERTVGGVERLFQTHRARDDVAGDGGGRVELAARPVGDRVGIAPRRADDLEVGVADEQSFRGLESFCRLVGRGVVVARDKRRRDGDDHEDHEQDQDRKFLSFHNVLYKN